MYIFPSHPAPGKPRVTVILSTATTISLSWSVRNGSVVESYEVTWGRDGIRSSTTITDGSTTYTIRELKAEANYMITVAARNGAGRAVSDPITGTTGKAGSITCVKVFEPYCIGGVPLFFLGGRGGALQWKNTGSLAITSMHTNDLVFKYLIRYISTTYIPSCHCCKLLLYYHM